MKIIISNYKIQTQDEERLLTDFVFNFEILWFCLLCNTVSEMSSEHTRDMRVKGLWLN